jgi:hypothetical protein
LVSNAVPHVAAVAVPEQGAVKRNQTSLLIVVVAAALQLEGIAGVELVAPTVLNENVPAPTAVAPEQLSFAGAGVETL